MFNIPQTVINKFDQIWEKYCDEFFYPKNESDKIGGYVRIKKLLLLVYENI